MSRFPRRSSIAVAMLLLASAASAQEVHPVVNRVVASWSRGDAAGIASLAARAGVAVELRGERSGPHNTRQLSAVLRGVFEESETDSTRVVEARTVDGDPQRAFGQFAWTMRVRGTTIPQQSTVFLAFARENEAWKITEIRLMR